MSDESDNVDNDDVGKIQYDFVHVSRFEWRKLSQSSDYFF